MYVGDCIQFFFPSPPGRSYDFVGQGFDPRIRASKLVRQVDL